MRDAKKNHVGYVRPKPTKENKNAHIALYDTGSSSDAHYFVGGRDASYASQAHAKEALARHHEIATGAYRGKTTAADFKRHPEES
jgi:hypothetical protein